MSVIIKGTTRIVAIFGDPVGHSLSPVIQNAAFAALKLDCAYVAFNVKPEDLKSAVNAVRALNMPGANVTIPHKVAIMKYLDKIDVSAKTIGAVNTIVNSNGRLVGYNTDGEGYLKSLVSETEFSPKGKNVVVLGAGGASRGIVFALSKAGVKNLTIVNRTVSKARALAREAGAKFKAVNISFSGDVDADTLTKAHLLVNTTSVGMKGKGGKAPIIDVRLLPKNVVISDIVYNPLSTPLIKSAVSSGLKTHKGLGMLVHQGALGFKLWTGKSAPVKVMMEAAYKAIGGKQ